MLWKAGLLIAIFCGGLAAVGQQRPMPALHEHREAASDIEVMGMVKGVPLGESRFISKEWVSALPRVSMRMMTSDDFPGIPKSGVTLEGVAIDVLARNLGMDANASAIEAICNDGYTATYTREYVRQHRPVLVLTMDGLGLHEWAMKHHQYDPEPYFIGYDRFAPAFHVLSYQDKPLEPTGVVKLRFDTEATVYAGIQAKPAHSREVSQGYLIARQNCFRCHNAGEHGGTKAEQSWSELGEIARTKPERFAAWVHNPQSIDPQSEMPANQEFDKATLAALQRYFATFATPTAGGQ